MLFSEPKIPQPQRAVLHAARAVRFSALQRAENSSTSLSLRSDDPPSSRFSALQRAENSSTIGVRASGVETIGFSALQRAENSSTMAYKLDPSLLKPGVSVLFSEPKIPQLDLSDNLKRAVDCFSALQRAENSSTERGDWTAVSTHPFQCSSASRKFLNFVKRLAAFAERAPGFSALQRAENSSTESQPKFSPKVLDRVSVLFSEPKIPQLNRRGRCCGARWRIVSVLFSEPKIPQLTYPMFDPSARRGFSALQRAENSSTGRTVSAPGGLLEVSVLFSEPKIPQQIDEVPF